MEKLKTISGREINVSENKSKRTFTIRADGSKYRTVQLARDEFKSCQRNTGNDWQSFLNSNDGSYYLVK